jgi:hypothetical protein
MIYKFCSYTSNQIVGLMTFCSKCHLLYYSCFTSVTINFFLMSMFFSSYLFKYNMVKLSSIKHVNFSCVSRCA